MHACLYLSEYLGFSMSMDCSLMSNLFTRVYVILLMMLSVRVVALPFLFFTRALCFDDVIHEFVVLCSVGLCCVVHDIGLCSFLCDMIFYCMDS